jgi:glycine cleavage system H protein
MTVLLVLCTLILFLVADHFVQKRRVSELVPARMPQGFNVPEGISLAQNHTWSREDERGRTTLGLDELIGRLVGTIDEIILPPLDASVSPATVAFSIRQGGKTLSFAPPVSGRIVEVNRNVMENPHLAQGRPYTDGWLMKIHPTTAPRRAGTTGTAAIAWLQQQTDLVKEFLGARSSHPGVAFMQDGGIPAAGVLSSFDEAVWNEFQQQFASLSEPSLNSRAKVTS